MTPLSLLSPAGLVPPPASRHVAGTAPGSTQSLSGGQNAVDSHGALVGGDDIAAQVEQVMTNLETALAAAGATVDHLASLSIALVEGVDLRAGYAVAVAHLSRTQPPPLVAATVVRSLAVPGALVELSAVAVLP